MTAAADSEQVSRLLKWN